MSALRGTDASCGEDVLDVRPRSGSREPAGACGYERSAARTREPAAAVGLECRCSGSDSARRVEGRIGSACRVGMPPVAPPPAPTVQARDAVPARQPKNWSMALVGGAGVLACVDGMVIVQSLQPAASPQPVNTPAPVAAPAVAEEPMLEGPVPTWVGSRQAHGRTTDRKRFRSSSNRRAM